MERILSGIKPSGDLTIGNYIGAIKQFIELQNEFELFVFVADLHAITVPQEKQQLKKRIKDIVALYLACGLDPEKTTIFIQSEIPSHAELSWVLQCHTYMGELSRMTQYKDKALKNGTDGLSAGLFSYPALMAADIILYDPKYVPIGDDQKQHMELTRDITIRFNNKYGDTFVVPEGFYPKTGARIMDLQDASKKMSKSDDTDKGYILLLDELNRVKNKIKSAMTDSGKEIKYDKINKPEISNLLTIYASVTNKTIAELEKEYQGMGYGDFKKDLAEAVVEFLKPIQERFNEIRNSSLIDEVLDKGRETASRIAYKKMRKVYKKIGLGR